MAELTNEEFYDKWVPLLADNVFQDINGARLGALMADIRDSFASVASQNGQPVPPAVNFDPVNRLLTAYHPLGVAELEYTQHNGGFTPWPAAPIQVDELAHPQGEWRVRVRADAGRSASQLSDSPQIAVKAVVTPAGPGTIKSTMISDSTEAGRALLTAADVAAQRLLLDQLNLEAGHYAPGQPKFTTLMGENGALAFLLRNAAGGAKPAAPLNGHTDDTADIFYGTVQQRNPVLGDYELFYPGSAGVVSAAGGRADLVGTTLTIRGLTGNNPVGSVGMRRAASGNVPASDWLTNADAFTGTVAPPSTLIAGLAIAVASIVAGNPLIYTVTASGGTGPYTYAVVATNTATGASMALGSATAGSWTPATAGDYELTATVTDAVGASKTAPVRALHVSGAPLANAGADNFLTQPASSATLQGSGYEAGYNGVFTFSWSQSAGPVSVSWSSKTVAQPTVSGLSQVGSYTFQLIVADAQGNVSLGDEVVVTVVAASTSPTTITLANSDVAYNAYGNQAGLLWHSALAGAFVQTNAPYVDVAYTQSGAVSAPDPYGLAAFLGGTFDSFQPASGTGNLTARFNLAGAGTRLLEVREGVQEGSADESGPTGFTTIHSVTFPAGYSAQLVKPAPKADVMVVGGDSISVGVFSTIPQTKHWNPVLRALRPELDIYCTGWGYKWLSRSLDTKAKRAAEIARAQFCWGSATTKRYVCALGTNDMGGGVDATLAMSYAGLLYDEMLAAQPDVIFYVQLVLNYGTAGSQAYRSAALALKTSARPGLRFIDCGLPTLADSLHPSDAGYATMANAYHAQLDVVPDNTIGGTAFAFRDGAADVQRSATLLTTTRRDGQWGAGALSNYYVPAAALNCGVGMPFDGSHFGGLLSLCLANAFSTTSPYSADAGFFFETAQGQTQLSTVVSDTPASSGATLASGEAARLWLKNNAAGSRTVYLQHYTAGAGWVDVQPLLVTAAALYVQCRLLGAATTGIAGQLQFGLSQLAPRPASNFDDADFAPLIYNQSRNSYLAPLPASGKYTEQYEHKGLTKKYFAEGQTCELLQRVQLDSGNAVFGLLTTATVPTRFEDLTYALLIGDESHELNTVLNGTITPVGPLAGGEYIKLRREGQTGALSLSISTDGVTYTPLTSALDGLTYTGALYICFVAQDNASTAVVAPDCVNCATR